MPTITRRALERHYARRALLEVMTITCEQLARAEIEDNDAGVEEAQKMLANLCLEARQLLKRR